MRILNFIFVILLTLVVVSQANAIPTTSIYTLRSTNTGQEHSTGHLTTEVACQAAGYSAAGNTADSGYCDGGGWYNWYVKGGDQNSCPTNSTYNGSSCDCDSGYFPDAGGTLCELPTSQCSLSNGSVSSSGFYDLGISESAIPVVSACIDNCNVTYDGSGVAYRSLVSGVYHYYSLGFYSSDGTTCSPNTTSLPVASASMPSSTCGVGESLGWINGQPLCVSSGSETPASTTQDQYTTSTDGQTGAVTDTTTSYTPTGDQTTTTTVTQTDGSSTTTTTTIPATDTANNSFCAENPTAPACKAQQSDCEKNPETIGCMDAGTPVDNLTLGTANKTLDITPYNFGIAGVCPAPITASLTSGQVISFPYDDICNFASLINPLVIAVAWLSAGLFLFSGLRA